MDAMMKLRCYKILAQAIKIMLGSSMAMFIAQQMNLQFATSAGIITLLTIATTKLETIRLSIYRVITYVFTVILSWIIFQNISGLWIAYGIFIFIIIFVSELIGWRATISVNAVIGTHYLSTTDFSFSFMLNELMLVLIGISMAIILDLFNNNSTNETRLIHNMQYTEQRFSDIVGELIQYLKCEPMGRDVWKDTMELEKKIEHFIEQACEYNNNTFKKEGDYYEHYFEMRLMQLAILHNLHYEMRKMRSLPKEVNIIVNYMEKLQVHMVELSNPRTQINEIEDAFEQIVQSELPTTAGEFESRAKLYHILMDLEELLRCELRFVKSVVETDRYKNDYHNTKKIVSKGK